jgi:hypothetical protein
MKKAIASLSAAVMLAFPITAAPSQAAPVESILAMAGPCRSIGS